ncbi:hypothetical protein QJS10_CPA03g02479 [Acorus calamus]|uniref:Uncharacterized protein n=1 Tax=Acorus calamus TaxID=4465 RepID=A0AAV9F3A4_ACOCL|nr:hypothetical protein QJS10_CPA03g02479 [Acorus calamus]
MKKKKIKEENKKIKEEKKEEVGEDTEEGEEDREDYWAEGGDTEEDDHTDTVAIYEHSVPQMYHTHVLMEEAVAENVHPCIYEIGSYLCNEIEVDQLFTNKKPLINAVRTWSIKKCVQYHVVKSNAEKYIVQ